MNFQIKPKKIVVSGNVLLMKPLSRRRAVFFKEQMDSAGENSAEQERLGLELIAENVTFEDGSALDPDDVPMQDLVDILKGLVGGGDAKSVSDFTPTP